MIRAMLNSQKIIIIKPLKPQPMHKPFRIYGDRDGDSYFYEENPNWPESGNMFSRSWICPYGQVGDDLWVKETRITFEVVKVQIERLQEITDNDAEKEANPWCWVVEFNKKESNG